MLKPAPFHKLFAGLGSTNKSATSILFYYFVTPATLSFLLRQSLWQEPASLSSCSIRLQWVPEHSFLPGNDAADEPTRREALLMPSAIPCSLSLIFFRTGGVLSHLNSSTHRFLLFPLRNLCTLVTLAVCSLVFAATNIAYW